MRCLFPGRRVTIYLVSVRFHTGILVLLLTLGLAGCGSVGPLKVQSDFHDYNDAIVQTQNEQLLHNLVRLRYRDTIFFNQMRSLSTQYEFRTTGGADIELINRLQRWDNLGLDSTLSFSEKPTITYAPMNGDQFSRQLMSPIPLESLLMLSLSGWSQDRIFRCCIQRMNDVQNAPSATGPTPDYVPEYQDARQLGHLMRVLQRLGALELETERDPEGEVAGVYYRIVEGFEGNPSVDEFRDLLGLSGAINRFRLTTDLAEPRPDEIRVMTRSLLGVMFYLSQGVTPPVEDERSGIVTLTTTETGEPFAWENVLGSLMQVHSSPDRPEDAFVRVRYRGNWFSIADSDLDSKSTFMLLTLLFNLQAGGGPGGAPLLTLPIGG